MPHRSSIKLNTNYLRYAALACGATVFSLPLIWMILTSIKVPSEINSVTPALFPTAPKPQHLSPYVASPRDLSLFCPEDIPEATWKTIEPSANKTLAELTSPWLSEKWTQHAFESQRQATQFKTCHQVFITALWKLLEPRLSDVARKTPTKKIVIEEIRRRNDPKLFPIVFENIFKSFLITNPKYKSVRHETVDWPDEMNWQVKSGNGEIVSINSDIDRLKMLQYTLKKGTPLVLYFAAPMPEFPLEQLKSVSTHFNFDESWAKLNYRVQVGRHAYTTSEWNYAFNSTWLEKEFVFPHVPINSNEPRSFDRLVRIEPFSSKEKEFVFEITITPVGTIEAWIAKVTRNYSRLFKEIPYSRYLQTSLCLVLLNVMIAIFSCTLVAYAFAVLEWPGRDIWFAVLLATMMIPPQVTMVPNFLVIRHLGWFNTLLPLWMPSLFGAPFFIFLLRQFMKNIPRDMLESSRLDGCGFLRVYWYVVLPWVRPTVIAISIFTGLASWNAFMAPLIYLNDENLYPLSLGLFRLNLQSGGDISLMMASSFLMTLPIILIFLLLQKHFIEGIRFSGK